MKTILYSLFIVILFFFHTKDCYSQKKTIDSLKNILQESSGKEKVKLLNEIAKILSKDTTRLSLYYGKKALLTASVINDENGIIISLTNLGYFYFNKSIFDSSAFYLKKALKTAIVTKNEVYTANCYRDLGKVYFYITDYTVSLNYSIKALKVYELLEDTKNIGNTCNDIGLIYSKLNNFKNAILYFNKALNYSEKIGNNIKKATVLNNIGTLYLNEKKTDLALKLFKKSLAIQKNLGNKCIAPIYNNIGNIYFLNNNLDSALIYLQKSFSDSKKTNFKYGETKVLINMAKIYIEKENYKKAFILLKKAEKLAFQINSKELVRSTYQKLYEVNLKTKKFEKACNNLLLYKLYSDSIFNEKKSTQIIEMQIKYETEKKDNQILLLEKEKELSKSKLKREKLYRNFSFIIILFIGIVIIIIFYDNRIKKKLNTRLKNNQNFLNTLMNTNPNPMFYKDIKGRYIGCNNSFLKIIGFKKNRILGKKVSDIYNIHKSNNHEKIDEELLKNPGIKQYYGNIHIAGGEKREFEFIKTVYKTEEKKIGGILGIMVDITDIKNQEKKIREQQDLLYKQEKEKLQNKLFKKEKELTKLTIHLIKDSKKSAKYITDIQSLKPFLKPKGKEKAQIIINKYKQEYVERNWEEFELRFKQSHKEFYNKIETKLQHLTQTEKRVCTFLFLKMSTKQIAALTYKSIRTIESTRAGIRKKLNINNTAVSLTEYLLNL